VTYETAEALRTALEHRLNSQSRETGVGIDRLRRRVVFERVIARLAYAEPDTWVLKGGMALEVRLKDAVSPKTLTSAFVMSSRRAPSSKTGSSRSLVGRSVRGPVRPSPSGVPQLDG
jgi:hypothetical protein